MRNCHPGGAFRCAVLLPLWRATIKIHKILKIPFSSKPQYYLLVPPELPPELPPLELPPEEEPLLPEEELPLLLLEELPGDE